MLTLFHNAVSTCSQKVRWTLSEKGLDYESREIDLLAGDQHASWYTKIHPDHVVPALVHDETIIRESSLIMMYLDQVGQGDPLVPDDPLRAHQTRAWMHLIDHKIHADAAVLTFALGPRGFINAQPSDVREASIAKIVEPTARAQRRSVLDHGVKAPEFGAALKRFMGMLEEMEASLKKSDWLVGSELSLADGAVLPYVLRLQHLGIYELFNAYPSVSAWFSRMMQRPSFDDSIRRWIPESTIELLKQEGLKEQKAIQQLIDELDVKEEANA